MQALKIDPKILREKMWKTTRQNNFSLMCSKGGERERVREREIPKYGLIFI